MNANLLYSRVVKFCPECAKELEVNLVSGWLACFLHGDFEIIDDRICWKPTKNLIKRSD